MPPKKFSSPAPAPRSHGHLISDVRFGRGRFIVCTCGHRIDGARSDDAQGDAFRDHRSTSPPEAAPPVREEVPMSAWRHSWELPQLDADG